MTRIDPAQSPEESTAKFAGKVIRTTLARMSYAECSEDDCSAAWTGPSSIGASGQHVVGTGHTVIQHYEGMYEMRPNIKALKKAEKEQASH